jgi:hypothetical protein
LDTLKIDGVSAINGEYPVDVLAMITLGSPECLSNRECHQLKNRTGLRLGEIHDALRAGDNDVYVGLAEIVLQRAGKRFDPDSLWDARVGAIAFTIGEREEEAVEDGPPVEAPTQIGAHSTSGGGSSSQTSGLQVIDPSRTGHPASEKSAVSAPVTLAI